MVPPLPGWSGSTPSAPLAATQLATPCAGSGSTPRRLQTSATGPPTDRCRNTERGNGHRGDRILLDERRPRRLVPYRQRCPTRRLDLEPLVEQLSDLAPARVAGRLDGQLGRNTSRIPLGAMDRARHLRRVALTVTAGVAAHLPDAGTPLADGGHRYLARLTASDPCWPLHPNEPQEQQIPRSEAIRSADPRWLARSPTAGSVRCLRRCRRSWRRGASVRRGTR